MRSTRTWKMTRIGLLTAAAIVLYLFEIPIVAFYKLDLSTFPAILAGFSMGPIAGFLVILLKNLFHMTISSTMYVGEAADLLMSCALVLPASLLYQRKKTLGTALIGLGIGTICIAIVGALTNYFIMLPVYMLWMNYPEAAILGMAQAALPSVDSLEKLVIYITLPFNLLKGFVLSALTLLVYKRLSPLLHQRPR